MSGIGRGNAPGIVIAPHTVIMDGETLHPRPIDLLRLMDFDVLNQLVQHPGSELSGPRVLADRRDEHIRRHSLALGAFNALLQGFDLGPEFLLFVLILGGHSGKTLVTQLTGHIVLINTLEQGTQVMALSRQVLLSTAELIKCAEVGATDISTEEKLMDTLIDNDYTTSDSIAFEMLQAEQRVPVTIAVANLYLRRQIVFERV